MNSVHSSPSKWIPYKRTYQFSEFSVICTLGIQIVWGASWLSRHVWNCIIDLWLIRLVLDQYISRWSEIFLFLFLRLLVPVLPDSLGSTPSRMRSGKPEAWTPCLSLTWPNSGQLFSLALHSLPSVPNDVLHLWCGLQHLLSDVTFTSPPFQAPAQPPLSPHLPSFK